MAYNRKESLEADENRYSYDTSPTSDFMQKFKTESDIEGIYIYRFIYF